MDVVNYYNWYSQSQKKSCINQNEMSTLYFVNMFFFWQSVVEANQEKPSRAGEIEIVFFSMRNRAAATNLLNFSRQSDS